MSELRFRQIHLDFHTSEKISPVAAEFDPERFAATLKKACVDSVTVFSRCHHGMIYHDTRFEEARHPGLTRNLLKEQIEACHAADVRAPVYITVGLDEFQATRHPEWLEMHASGRMAAPLPLEPGYKKLCFNTPYFDYVVAQTEEVLENFEVDGIFFDIIHQGACVCRWCLESMTEQQLDPEVEAHRRAFAAQTLDQARRRLMARVRQHNKDCTVFFNSGHVSPAFRPVLDCYTHLELESLPSGGWGYDHFPATVRYARTLGPDLLGMTGKFHKSWGDFGGFKPRAALEYECFAALAEGAKCSVGDQLHPTGRLDPATYELIGGVYASVAEKERWCRGAKAVTEVALFTPEAQGLADGRVDTALGGALRILLEGHHQFDIVDAQTDWSRYAVVILPDKVMVNDEMRAKLTAYLDGGGALIASHRSGMRQLDAREFAVEQLPVRYAGEARFSPDYVEPCGPLGDGLARSQHVMYEPALEVEPVEGAERWAEVWQPYFNRAWNHFCSHAQAPAEKPTGRPAVVRKGNVVYFAHPVFAAQMRHGAPCVKPMALDALRALLPEPLVLTNAPSTARVTVSRQLDEDRYVAHVLHYIPEQRNQGPPVVEEAIPLHGIELGLRLPAPSRVYLAPSEEELAFEERDGRVWVTAPKVDGHAMVVFER